MTRPCGCPFSDAWRCADARNLVLMTCHCHCHRSADDPIRAAITRAQDEFMSDGAIGVDLAAPGSDVTVFYCPTCRTQLAFDGDVCGLCHPDGTAEL